MTFWTGLPDAFHHLVPNDNFYCQTPLKNAKFGLFCGENFHWKCQLANLVASPAGYGMHFPAILSNYTWHDSVHLPSVYTDYSFSSLNLKLRHDIGLYVTETTAKCGLCNVRIFNILLKILMGTLEIQERKMPEESDSSQVYVYRASIFTRTPQSKPPIEAAVIRVCFPCSTSPSTTPTAIDTFLNSLVILTVV